MCAYAAAAAGLLYALSFVVLKQEVLYSLFLLLGGALSIPVVVAVYGRLVAVDRGVALTALLFAAIGALGSLVHGGYDLARALHPVGAPALPNAVDPRGLLTFGLTGVGVALVAWLMARGGGFPRWLPRIGYGLAALSLVLYLGRLIILDASNPLIVVAALLAGFVFAPAWSIGLGGALLRGPDAQPAPAGGVADATP
jgi:hypothetical protein